MHPWYSRVKDYDTCNAVAAASSSFSSTILNTKEKKCGLKYPELIVFDLDPYIYLYKQDDEEAETQKDPKYQINSFRATVDVAYNPKDLLDMLEIKSYVKISGKTGLHVFVPIKNSYSYNQTRKFAQAIGKILVRRFPQKVTMEWDTRKRRGKVFFDHNQNAIVAKNAELYYRKMIEGGTATWNISDTPMMDTLKRLMEFYGREDSKSIVWAHNTHIGDARYTEMADAKMLNIGQLVREYASEKNVFLVGFGTYQGTVIAAREWGDKMQRMYVPPAEDGSWDNLIHNQSNGRNSLLVFRDDNQRNTKGHLLTEETRSKRRRGQRAIGVVYNPKYERYGNYVPTNLAKRYDAFLHIDKTRALHSLRMPEMKEDKDLPETFPFGL